jgi:predicted AAA+ superfamily ATPase
MGLFTYFSNKSLNDIVIKTQRDKISGIFFENYISIELSRYNIKQFYWKGKKSAEIEFILTNSDNQIFPVDVKANKGNFKSIGEYIKMNKMEYAVKISQNNLGFSNKIKTIPLYMAFLFLKEFNQNKN